MKKLEYSQVVRRKMQALKQRLTREFDATVSKKNLKRITDAAKGLEVFPQKGILLSDLYDIESDYRYLYIRHNYLIYRIEGDKVIVVEMFDEREDFIYQLFGIITTSQESLDYWGE